MENKLTFKPPYMMLINGKQNAGKSHYLRWLMREQSLSDHPFDYGIIFSNTIFEKSFDYIDEKYQYDTFDEEILKNLMKIQKKNVEKGIIKEAFVIFDDMLDDESQWDNETMKKLSTQLRHYHISLLISTQYCHLIKPRFRANSMYSLFFDIGCGKREMQSIYEAYGGHFNTYNDFKQFYYKNVKDHKFVLYDKEEDSYKTYKCPEEIPKFFIKYNLRYNK